MRRADLDAMLAELREGGGHPTGPTPKKFYRRHTGESKRPAFYYLSPEPDRRGQTPCADDHWERQHGRGARTYVVIEAAAFAPTRRLTDEYLIDLPPASPPLRAPPPRFPRPGSARPYRLSCHPCGASSATRRPSSINEPCPARWKMILKADRRKERQCAIRSRPAPSYEIDLSKKNARAFPQATRAVHRGMPVRQGRGSPRAPCEQCQGRARSSAIRAWAKDQGHPGQRPQVHPGGRGHGGTRPATSGL